MKTLITFLLLIIPFIGNTQNTFNSTGNWSDPTKWIGGIADQITENVSIVTNVTVTVLNGSNYIVGNVNLVQDNTLTVNNGGLLTLGSSTLSKILITGMNAKLEIKGELIIWGDLIANSNIDITMSGGGKLTIHGKLKLNSNTNINMSGGSLLEVFGNFEGSANNNVGLSGSNSTVLVHGNVNVAGGSNLNPGSGSFQYGGSCADGSSNFCNSATPNPALPIELLSFTGRIENGKPILRWSTATEKNNDYFIINRYENGETWEVGRVQGAGTSNTIQTYEWVDNTSNLSGKVYYQLTQVDYDLKSESFKLIVVDMNTKVLEGFVVGEDETVISSQVVDELGRPVSTDTGFRIVRLLTNKHLYTRKEFVTQ